SPPPAQHRPGARSARPRRCLLPLTQTEGDFTMVSKKQNRLCIEPLEHRCLLSVNVVVEWNQLALQSIGQARVSPVVASRALAIHRAAAYDAVNATDGSFEPYYAETHASHGASLEAAAAQAAHDTLAALFPSQSSTFDAALAADVLGIPPGQARQGTA